MLDNLNRVFLIHNCSKLESIRNRQAVLIKRIKSENQYESNQEATSFTVEAVNMWQANIILLVSFRAIFLLGQSRMRVKLVLI